jgi:hypothetical protein
MKVSPKERNGGDKIDSESDSMKTFYSILEMIFGESNPILVEELYSQIVKQITNNPNRFLNKSRFVYKKLFRDCLKRGWKLLSLLCGFILNERIYKYLLSFIINSYPLIHDSGIQEYITFAFNRIQKTFSNHNRLYLPSLEELMHLKVRNQNLINYLILFIL